MLSFRVLGSLSLVLLAGGCRPAVMMAANCVRPSDCPEGLVCRSGLCDRCGGDIDCPSGLRCDAPGTPTARCASPDAGPVDGSADAPDASALDSASSLDEGLDGVSADLGTVGDSGDPDVVLGPEAPVGAPLTLTALLGQTVIEPADKPVPAMESALDCGSGRVLLGVRGFTEGGLYVTQVRPLCGTLGVVGPAGSQTLSVGVGVEGPLVGPAPVVPASFTAVCGSGRVLVGFRLNGWSGGINSVGFDCAVPSLVAGRVTLGVPTMLPEAGGTQRASAYARQCPTNGFARGLRYALYDTYLVGLGLACYSATYP